MRHFPALFLSDLHLGSRACRDTALLAFLKAHTADKIYLVGDLFDTWQALGANWTAKQHEIVLLLLQRAREGTQLIYTPGNHDAFFRRYLGQNFAGVEVIDRLIHISADGTRYLVVHGDSCDIFAIRLPLLARLGAVMENSVRGVGNWANALRRRFRKAEWTIVDLLVSRVNQLIRAQDNFEVRLAQLARDSGADGIICGHFHAPALHRDHGVIYANCGDWVENCSALAETGSGRLLLLDWSASGGTRGVAAQEPAVFGPAAEGV